MKFYIIEDDYPLKALVKLFGEHTETCSITDLKDWNLTFIRNIKYLKYLLESKMNIRVLCPLKHREHFQYDFPGNITFIFVKDVDYAFTSYHNLVHKFDKPKKNKIGKNCRIHPRAIIGVEGIKFANAPDGSKLQFIHTGDVILGNNIEVGANSIIHRGSMGSTIIRDNVKIGVMVNIGHNNDIGKNTIVVGGTITSGSVKVGENCWLCAGTLIRNGVNICDNVIVGMGSMVMKDITESGIYYGRPAIRKGDYIEDFNL